MKNNVAMLGLAVTASLCMGVAFSCAKEENKISRRPQESRRHSISENRAQGPVNIHIESDRTAAPSADDTTVEHTPASVEITDEMKRCDPSQSGHQCMAIPVHNCDDCSVEGGAMIAVNAKYAKEIMMPRKEVCLKAFQNRKAPSSAAEAAVSQHPSCKFNKAECKPDGMCGLGVMTPQEEQELQKKMQERMQQMKQMQQQQGNGQGQQGMAPAGGN